MSSSGRRCQKCYCKNLVESSKKQGSQSCTKCGHDVSDHLFPDMLTSQCQFLSNERGVGIVGGGGGRGGGGGGGLVLVRSKSFPEGSGMGGLQGSKESKKVKSRQFQEEIRKKEDFKKGGANIRSPQDDYEEEEEEEGEEGDENRSAIHEDAKKCRNKGKKDLATPQRNVFEDLRDSDSNSSSNSDIDKKSKDDEEEEEEEEESFYGSLKFRPMPDNIEFMEGYCGPRRRRFDLEVSDQGDGNDCFSYSVARCYLSLLQQAYFDENDSTRAIKLNENIDDSHCDFAQVYYQLLRFINKNLISIKEKNKGGYPSDAIKLCMAFPSSVNSFAANSNDQYPYKIPLLWDLRDCLRFTEYNSNLGFKYSSSEAIRAKEQFEGEHKAENQVLVQDQEQELVAVARGGDINSSPKSINKFKEHFEESKRLKSQLQQQHGVFEGQKLTEIEQQTISAIKKALDEGRQPILAYHHWSKDSEEYFHSFFNVGPGKSSSKNYQVGEEKDTISARIWNELKDLSEEFTKEFNKDLMLNSILVEEFKKFLQGEIHKIIKSLQVMDPFAVVDEIEQVTVNLAKDPKLEKFLPPGLSKEIGFQLIFKEKYLKVIVQKVFPLCGHVVNISFHDPVRKCFVLINSWTKHWGDSGYFRIAENDLFRAFKRPTVYDINIDLDAYSNRENTASQLQNNIKNYRKFHSRMYWSDLLSIYKSASIETEFPQIGRYPIWDEFVLACKERGESLISFDAVTRFCKDNFRDEEYQNLKLANQILTSHCLNHDQLIEAIEQNDVGTVLELITSGEVDVNMQIDQNWNTALHIAVLRKNLSIASILILAGANLNSRNCDFYSPLHLACFALGPTDGSTFVQLLLSKSKYIAQKFSLSHMKQTFLRQSGSINSGVYCTTAMEHNPIRSAKLANIELINKEGGRPIHDACRCEQPEEILKILLKEGADVNARTEKEKLTALHIMCERGELNSVLLILDHPDIGATINAINSGEGARVVLLAKSNKEEIINALKQRGISPTKIIA